MTNERVTVIGATDPVPGSEVYEGDTALVLDRSFVVGSARTQDAAGFDKTLIAVGVSSPDSTVLSALVLSETERLGVLAAFRPNREPPTSAARRFATLDALWPGGRVAVNVVSGASDADARREGDDLTKRGRYDRAAEFLQVFRKALTSSEPFDFSGGHYQVEQGVSDITTKPASPVEIYFGGHSPKAIDVGSRFADVHASWGTPLSSFAPRVAEIRRQAAEAGRSVRISASFRPIIGRTEVEAWATAERYLETARRRLGSAQRAVSAASIAGHEDLWRAAAERTVHDERLWLGITQLAGAKYDTAAPVGTAEQVADLLRRYVEIGVTDFIIRGFGDPLKEFAEWGRELIPRLHDLRMPKTRI
ncbi:LLM class flavin-dependent oxidoreductase [Herbiconiux daphne]|uniref:LLM class flavin-dependent oxidoreductase n=1 Tax=Herbiconiux daphne TaxID=2970914 RepID=A0ABT2H6W0_9MICO|nr:LLM class flavin-dependent oxidoreductase [Herbiconiux daphne]MCS5735654.1 LLM class flavin-dependent oxidoreductase [Herbiconiux daphne]